VSASAGSVIDLTTAPRKNVGLSHKEVATLLNLETLSARCGAPLDARRLRECFEHGDLRLAGDRRCELFDAATKRELHAMALAAAEECGISAYGRFFGDAGIEETPTPLSSDPDALSDGDLSRLVAELQQASPA
jgi:hypothetical protein